MKFSEYLWLTPFFSFLCGYLLIGNLYRVEDATVPSLVGKQLPQVFVILSQHNLNLRLLDEKDDQDLPAGTILSQTPAAGEKIKSDKAIYCVVSKKPNQQIMPLLINKHRDEITTELAQKNLRQRHYYLPSNLPRETCIAHYPRYNEPVEGTTVITYISESNKKPVIMPAFKNKLLSEVTEFLATHNITPVVTHTFNKPHDCSECVVVDQRPLPGSLITLQENKPLSVQLQVR